MKRRINKVPAAIIAVAVVSIFLICLVYYYDKGENTGNNIITIRDGIIDIKCSDKLVKTGDTPDLLVMGLCIIFTFVWARIAAVFANKAKPATLNRAVGIVLTVLGVAILGFKYLG